MRSKKIWILVLVLVTFVFSCYWFYGVKVEVSLRVPAKDPCPLNKPIYIQIKNRSLDTIRDIDMTLYLFENGLSENLLEDSKSIGNHYRFNGVVESFESPYTCIGDGYITKYLESGNDNENRTLIGKVIDEQNKYEHFFSTHKIYVSEISWKKF